MKKIGVLIAALAALPAFASADGGNGGGYSTRGGDGGPAINVVYGRVGTRNVLVPQLVIYPGTKGTWGNPGQGGKGGRYTQDKKYLVYYEETNNGGIEVADSIVIEDGDYVVHLPMSEFEELSKLASENRKEGYHE